MLKSLDTLGTQALNCIFNYCLSKGIYPWNKSVITPIHKSGDINNPDNYRAIAVSSCLGKTFSSILLNRLINFRNNHCSDPPNQLGFCKGAQTNDHVLTLKTIIEKYRKPGKSNIFACFVDFKKAFDSIRRDLLLSKIANLCINGAFFLVIKNMYEKSTAKIKINNLLSDSFNIDKGTEQGHPMSPELFKMFIRDLSSALTCTGKYPLLLDAIINHLLWADDLILLAIDESSLQNNLNILGNFCQRWGLTINFKKTKVICFGKRGKHTFYVGDNKIEYVDKYCYLGFMIHKNGNINSAVKDLRDKARRALYGLKRVVNKSYMSIDALFKLFDALIKPVLLYGCQVVTPYSKTAKLLSTNDLVNDNYFKTLGTDLHELFHLRFLKWCLGVHRKSSNIGTWGDTGRYPLIINACKLSVDYFLRIESMSNDTLIKRRSKSRN